MQHFRPDSSAVGKNIFLSFSPMPKSRRRPESDSTCSRARATTSEIKFVACIYGSKVFVIFKNSGKYFRRTKLRSCSKIPIDCETVFRRKQEMPLRGRSRIVRSRDRSTYRRFRSHFVLSFGRNEFPDIRRTGRSK